MPSQMTSDPLESEVKPLIEAFMKERGLELSPEKTLITHIEDGFDFLGQHLRKYNGKLLITPSRKNVHTFLVLQPHLQREMALQAIALLRAFIDDWLQKPSHKYGPGKVGL